MAVEMGSGLRNIVLLFGHNGFVFSNLFSVWINKQKLFLVLMHFLSKSEDGTNSKNDYLFLTITINLCIQCTRICSMLCSVYHSLCLLQEWVQLCTTATS